MNYYLMHKDDKVALLDVDFDTGKIKDYKVLEKDLIPSYVDRLQALNSWWSQRAIPKSRTNIQNFLRRSGIETTESLMLRNMALNLSDCYWVKAIDKDLKYREVNFYENDFELLDIASMNSPSKDFLIDKILKSPSSSLNGQVAKYWQVQDGKRVLVKTAISTGISKAQCVNEVFAYEFHKKINLYPAVEYKLNKDKDNSIASTSCPCFTSINVEYIPFANIVPYILLDVSLNITKIRNYIYNFLEQNGISKVESKNFFDYLHFTDFLISNIDRHLNNYGILRDSNNLKCLGFAPIFDNGNSMLYRGTLEFYDKRFRKLETENAGLYDKDEKLVNTSKNFIKDFDLSILISPREVYDFYKDNLYFQEPSIAKSIACAYSYKLKIATLLQEGQSLYNIIQSIKSSPIEI